MRTVCGENAVVGNAQRGYVFEWNGLLPLGITYLHVHLYAARLCDLRDAYWLFVPFHPRYFKLNRLSPAPPPPMCVR